MEKIEKKIAFHTLGCKVNQYETEVLKEKFEEKGYAVVGENDFADVYVINTCTVTGLADRKSRQYIRRMKKLNPNSIVAVTGCYAQMSPDEVADIEGVNIVTGTNEKNKLVQYVEEFCKKNCTDSVVRHIKTYEELVKYEETGIITSMESRTRAYIKIQEGCNRFCSYCVIPYARGTVRSRGVKEIVNEAAALLLKGFKEIILTGINTALYGVEEGFFYEPKEGSENLEGVEIIIKEINDLPGDFRIRLSSLEPTVINDEYVKRLLKYDKLCHHLHLSIQSGSDSILKSMNRHYDREEYMKIVDVLKDFDPLYGISTDIIVGFPGEREDDFKDSIEMIEKVRFCKVHGFKYSKRKGTKAADMKNQIAPEVKNRRSKILLEAGEKSAQKFFEKNIGGERRVLVEDFDVDTDTFIGYTDNYIKVYIKNTQSEAYKNGEFYKVKLTKIYKDGMKGE